MKYKNILIAALLMYLQPLFSQKYNLISEYLEIPECGITDLKEGSIFVSEARANCIQNFLCDDPTIRDEHTYDESQPMKIVKTKAVIVRDDFGLNPSTTERAIELEYHHLNRDFAKYGIQFTYIIRYLDNSAMLNVDNENELGTLFFNYATETDQYCNIFFTWYYQNLSLGFYPWQTIVGGQQIGHLGSLMNVRAQVYPWNHRSTLTHELGHILGLEHTFRGAQEVASCSDNCAENMSSIGDDVGDWCSDTPPQDRTTSPGFIQTNDCNATPFDPIPHTNYMSYSDNKLVFTPQQVARMHCYLENHPLRTGWIDDSNPEILYVNSDDFGHKFIEEVDIAVSDWIDISMIGTEVTGLLDDNIVGPLFLNFDGSFYAQNFDQIYIGSNGYISLSPLNINSNTSATGPLLGNIPMSGINNNFLAPFLTDLTFSGIGNTGKVYFWTNDTDTFIVTYESVPFFDGATNGFIGQNTFQLRYTVNESNPYGIITYHYLEMEDYYPRQMHFRPNPIIIGIENADGTDGLEIDNYRIPKNNTKITINRNQANSIQTTPNILNILVYPNPSSSGQITIDLGLSYNDVEFVLYNTIGQKIFSVNYQQVKSIDIPLEVPQGIYYLKVSRKDEVVAIKKIVKN